MAEGIEVKDFAQPLDQLQTHIGDAPYWHSLAISWQRIAFGRNDRINRLDADNRRLAIDLSAAEGEMKLLRPFDEKLTVAEKQRDYWKEIASNYEVASKNWEGHYHAAVDRTEKLKRDLAGAKDHLNSDSGLGKKYRADLAEQIARNEKLQTHVLNLQEAIGRWKQTVDDWKETAHNWEDNYSEKRSEAEEWHRFADERFEALRLQGTRFNAMATDCERYRRAHAAAIERGNNLSNRLIMAESIGRDLQTEVNELKRQVDKAPKPGSTVNLTVNVDTEDALVKLNELLEVAKKIEQANNPWGWVPVGDGWYRSTGIDVGPVSP